MAMALARTLHGQAIQAAEAAAQAQADEPASAATATAIERAGQATTAFNRAARTVRQTLALEARVRRERAAMTAGEANASGPLFEGRTREQWIEAERGMRGAWRRAAVRDALEPVIAGEPCEAERERLLADLGERLNAVTGDDGFIAQSVPALIAQIRRELGLRPPGPGDAPGDGADETGEAYPAEAWRSWMRRSGRGGP